MKNLIQRFALTVVCLGLAACVAEPIDPTADDDVAVFTTANRVLGNLVGETFGYLLTAAWTGLVLVALGAAFAGRLFVVLGGVAAVLILWGVFSPLELPAVDLANFVGYVLWSVWLLIFAAVLVRRGVRQPSRA